MQVDQVIHGDCLEILRRLPDNSVDAICTDPPAGIAFMSKDWDTFNVGKKKGGNSQAERDAQYGLHHPGSSPFGYSHGTGKTTLAERDTFIAFMTDVMSECLRVLKPGGHALVWALPRTSHWTATALENAGFEIREKLYHCFGSGFPKSLDVSKAIDKSLGAEREVVGIREDIKGGPGTAIGSLQKAMKEHGARKYTEGLSHDNNVAHYGGVPITSPVTPQARQWQGWGTSTKPAVEEWVLCRKPLSEPTIAQNVLQWGCGGLNIDATRIGTCADTPQYRPASPSGLGHGKNCYGTRDGHAQLYTQGRFPSHLLLSHHPLCQVRGVKRVLANGAENGKVLPRKQGNTYRPGSQRSSVTHRDPDGLEEVLDMVCVENCPVRQLDIQSGIRKSGGGIKAKANHSIGFLQGEDGYHFKHDHPVDYEPSEGGASRYFQTFHDPLDTVDAPFHYFSKASKSDREAGLSYLPMGQSFDKNTSKRIAHINHETGETTYSEYAPSSRHNTHPTCKSTSLMRWLCRLITPPGGIVLDPFFGSGSTGVAALQEGFHFIGIEAEQEYCEIARARIAHALAGSPAMPLAQGYAGPKIAASGHGKTVARCPDHDMSVQWGSIYQCGCPILYTKAAPDPMPASTIPPTSRRRRVLPPNANQPQLWDSEEATA